MAGNGERLPTQLEVLRNVMLLAAQYDSWMTLARKTWFPEGSISVQLRHLRKEEHGAYRVEKRRWEWQEALRTNAKERVWEYKVAGRREVASGEQGRRRQGGKEQRKADSRQMVKSGGATELVKSGDEPPHSKAEGTWA